MQKVLSAMKFKAHKTLCLNCNNHFFEIDEQQTEILWVGSRTTDIRETNCPHCGNEIYYKTVKTIETADVYLEINPITGELISYGGFL